MVSLEPSNSSSSQLHGPNCAPYPHSSRWWAPIFQVAEWNGKGPRRGKTGPRQCLLQKGPGGCPITLSHFIDPNLDTWLHLATKEPRNCSLHYIFIYYIYENSITIEKEENICWGTICSPCYTHLDINKSKKHEHLIIKLCFHKKMLGIKISKNRMDWWKETGMDETMSDKANMVEWSL